MKTTKQSAVVFLASDSLPERSAVERALEDLGDRFVWHEEHEIGLTYAFSVDLDGHVIGVSIIGGPLEPELYSKALDVSGFAEADRKTVSRHGSHARLVSMEQSGEPREPVLRMTDVYRVAARLCAMDGVAVLAPASGVFVVGLEPAHVDGTIDAEVPPLDMWIAVEKVDDDKVRSVGASVVDIPDVELIGVGILDAESTFATVMDVLLYLRRIRRELVPGETVHVGRQPWSWMALKSKKGTVSLRRVDPGESRSVRGS